MNDNPIKYSDLIQKDSSIDDLIKALDGLNDSFFEFSKSVKSSAESLKASLQGVSGATEEGRKTIRKAAAETDKLTKAEQERNFAYSETAKKIAALKAETHEQNTRLKLEEKLARSAAGSYDALSAQYSLNKMALNSMGEAEGVDVENKRALEEETNALYEQMKKLQEATGKHQLNVGNYADATKGLRSQIMELTEELVRLRMEGKQDSEEYQQTAEKAAVLKDAFKDAQTEVVNMANDTSTLNSVLGALGAAGGGFAAVTGAMSLFGDESEDVQEAQKKLQAAIALTNGVTAIQNSLQKQSNLMLGINKIQLAAKAKAEALATKSTVAATIAQKAFNLVAKANPYVLLATALISVVGALVAFSAGTSEAAKQQKQLNDLEKAWLGYLDGEADKMKTVSNERIAALQRELTVAKARNASNEETQKIEDEIFRERVKQHGQQAGFYAQEIADLDKNKSKVDELRKVLLQLNEAKAKGDKKIKIDVDLDGKVEKVKVDEAIEAVQGQIDNLGKKVEIATEIKTNVADDKAEADKRAAEAVQREKDKQQKVTATLRAAEDARLALISNSFDRERAQRKAAAERQTADIKFQLANDSNLTTTQRKALNEQMVSLRSQLAKDIIAINNAQAQSELQARRATEDATFALMAEGSEKRRILLATQYNREIEDIDNRLATEKGLTEAQATELYNQRIAIGEQYKKAAKELDDEIALESLNTQKQAIELRLAAVKEGSQEEADLKLQAIEKEREIELAQNRMLAEELRQDEAAINAKYDKMAADQARQSQYDIEMARFDEQQALAASEIDIMKTSEAKKTALRLKLEKERLQKILEMGVENGKALTDVEVQTIKNAIERINQEIKSANVPQDLYDVFGLTLNDDQKAAISESMQYAIDALNEWMDARVEAAEKAVAAAEKEVDAAQRAYELELQAKANGYAADVETAKKELELQKENQKKALEQQQQAQEAQAKIQTLEQIGNLVTATAKIWGQFGNPFVAIPMIAVMWASFAASKIMARNAAKEQYAEGTVELLQGGSHASGHDIDLGTKPDGTRRRAEGGEFFAVINKRNSRKFRKEIPEVIHSLNDGTFADKYLNTFNVGGVTVASADQTGVDLMPISEDVKAIREQNAKRYIVLADGTMVEMYKNLTRRVLS